MSTNNNRLGKEVRPDWVDEESKSCQMKKFSTPKLQRLMAPSCPADELTALSLAERGICSIEDTSGLSSLKRLDMSKNKLKRLAQMGSLSSLGMLNVSSNDLTGGESIEELRYLTELRTLNIGDNPNIGRIKKHTIRSLPHLQALIAHGCGISSTEFLSKTRALSTIVLSKNMLDSFPNLGHETSFANLVKLSIGHNKFTSFPDLSFCRNIEELRINNNKFESIPKSILNNAKLKTLDISSNQILSWGSIELLTGLPNLTNLCAKGNPLPEPPPEDSNFILREDLSAEKIDYDELHLRYRRHLLGLFQISVGKEQKLKVRLIVLDMKRVKAKWSHKSEATTASHHHQQKSSELSIKYREPQKMIPDTEDQNYPRMRTKKRNSEHSESAPEPPPLSYSVDDGVGEILAPRQKRVRIETNDKAAAKDHSQLVGPKVDAETTARVRPDRGQDSGVVAVSVPKKKQHSTSGTKAAIGSKRSIEDVLFGATKATADVGLGGWE